MTMKKSTPAGQSAPPRDAYHHGALRETLIDATETLLAERGVEGFSLREVARRSGVSPAAPAHHFGDAYGLLAVVATQAFDQLTKALDAGNVRGGNDPVARLREQGVGYVGFAMTHPGRFGLMFRSGLQKNETLVTSADAAFNRLECGVRALLEISNDAPLDPAQWQTLLLIWSVVHGFAQLSLSGQIEQVAASGNRNDMLRQVLAPMLDRQLRGLQQLGGKPRTRIRASASKVKSSRVAARTR